MGLIIFSLYICRSILASCTYQCFVVNSSERVLHHHRRMTGRADVMAHENLSHCSLTNDHQRDPTDCISSGHPSTAISIIIYSR
ncbi:hypothetical protein PENSPDRAFT_410171 [Peniophora sp. CONT]|nr:hypothetical protein PENSPDRAFT_410171 [Peniophora sp. CONT]